MLGTPPFQGLAEEDLAAFLFGTPNSLRRFNPGEFIALQGDLCRGLYVLAAGTVRAGMLGGEGKELTVEEIQAPALLALMRGGRVLQDVCGQDRVILLEKEEAPCSTSCKE